MYVGRAACGHHRHRDLRCVEIAFGLHQGLPRLRGDAELIGAGLSDPALFAAFAFGRWIVEFPSFRQVPSRGVRRLGFDEVGVGEVEGPDRCTQGRAWYGRWRGLGTFGAIAAAARLLVPTTLPTAAMVRNRRNIMG